MTIVDNISIELNAKDNNVTSTMTNVDKAINTTSNAMNKSATSAIYSMRSMLASVTYLQSTAAFAFGTLEHIFSRLITTTEKFKMSIAANASLVSTFAKPGQGDLGEVYKRAYEYSEKVQEKLVEINSLTVGNIYQMNLVYREFLKQGVQIDTNKQKQLDSFAVITNAIGILTAGMPNPDLQYGQEIRSVLEGVARQGTTLALVLKSILGPEWAKLIQQWKHDGNLIENLAQVLKGFEAGSNSLASTWTVVSSTMVTDIQYILSKGFEPLYNFIVSSARQINTYLMENKDDIIAYLTNLSSLIAIIVEKMDWNNFLNILKDIITILITIIGLKLAVNLANIIVVLGKLRTELLGANLAASIFSKTLRGAGFIGIALLVGEIAKAVWDIGVAWKHANDRAKEYKSTHPVVSNEDLAKTKIDQISEVLNIYNRKVTFKPESEHWFKEQNLRFGKKYDYYKSKKGDIVLTEAGAYKLTAQQFAYQRSTKDTFDTQNLIETNTSNLKERTTEDKHWDELNKKIRTMGFNSLSDNEIKDYIRIASSKDITLPKVLKKQFDKTQMYRAVLSMTDAINKGYGRTYFGGLPENDSTISGTEHSTPTLDLFQMTDKDILENQDALLSQFKSMTQEWAKIIIDHLGVIIEVANKAFSVLSEGMSDVFVDWAHGIAITEDRFQKLGQAFVDVMIKAIADVAAAFVTSGILDVLAYIPGFSWLKIPAATIRTRAGIGFAEGTDYVPYDMIATVHKGEQIIPRTYNEALTSGKISISNTVETNSLLNTMISKLDMIGQLAQEKGKIIIGESQLTVLSSEIFKRQNQAMTMGVL